MICPQPWLGLKAGCVRPYSLRSAFSCHGVGCQGQGVGEGQQLGGKQT